MTTYNVSSNSQLNSAISSLSAGDIINIAAGTYNPITISGKHGTAANPITIQIASGLTSGRSAWGSGGSSSVIFDGGHSSIINDLLAENPVSKSTTDNNDSCIKISTSSYIIIDGFEVRNESRGVHTDRSDHITVKNVYAHRLWDRAIGGTCNQLTVEDCVVKDAALENYNNRLKALTGSASGWPGVVATYRLSDGTHMNDFICRRVIGAGNCWGEFLAPFHCDTALFEDCIVIDSSHTVFCYLDQCRNVTVRGCFFMATSNVPIRENDGGSTRRPHGILCAREGSSFPYPSTGHVIYDNVIYGMEAGIRLWNDLEDTFGAEITFNTIIGSNDNGMESDPFAQTPNITVERNIIEDVALSSSTGFTFANNWIYGTNTPAYSTAGGGFTSPTPTYDNAGNESSPTRADYEVTNMPSSPFDHYGAYITGGGGGGDPEIPVLQGDNVRINTLWNYGMRLGIPF